MKETLFQVLNITWPTLTIVLSIVIIFRVTYLMKSERSFVFHNEFLTLVFLAYVLILFQLVTTQDLSGGGINLMPFQEILRYKIGSNEFYRQVLGNIVMFIPLGYFATDYCKLKKISGITIITLLCSGIIETVQHFIGRCFDIDDIILNVVGGIIGFLIFIALSAIKKHMPKVFQNDTLYNVISIIAIVLVVLYLIKII